MSSTVKEDTSMSGYQDMFLDDTVVDITTCQLCTFWERGIRSSSDGRTCDRTSNCVVL